MDTERIRQLADELHQMVENDTEEQFAIGDMVTYSLSGNSGFGQIESIDGEMAMVREYVEADGDIEETDNVIEVAMEQIQHRSSEHDETEDPEKGSFVSWAVKDGLCVGKVVDKGNVVVPETGEKHSDAILVEMYDGEDDFEQTGCHLAFDSKYATVIEQLPSKPKKLMVKFKGIKMEHDEEEKYGYIEGLASSYGNVDLGGDTVEKGAYTQTITHNNGKFKFMLDHGYKVADTFGVASVEDSDEGLKMVGKVPLNVPSVKECYDKIKFMNDEGIPMGLSIGYEVVKSEPMPNGVRKLKEIALHEISATPWPMDTHATITQAKSQKSYYQYKRNQWLPDAPTGNQNLQGVETLVGELKQLTQKVKENVQ